jgi:hypothetical protein
LLAMTYQRRWPRWMRFTHLRGEPWNCTVVHEVHDCRELHGQLTLRPSSHCFAVAGAAVGLSRVAQGQRHIGDHVFLPADEAAFAGLNQDRSHIQVVPLCRCLGVTQE